MGVSLLIGDAAEALARLPTGSVHCIVTSPPYFNLRSYLPQEHPGKALEIGNEASVADYVSKVVAIFRVARRVLRDDGTIWVNLGDTYVNKPVLLGAGGGRERRRAASAGAVQVCKPKDLYGVPWAVSTALRAGFSQCQGCGLEQRSDVWPSHNGQLVCIPCLRAGRGETQIVQTELGWYLRSEVIWSKSNPMPQSVRDRPSTSHETIFLLSKSPDYFYDDEAIKEPCSSGLSDLKKVVEQRPRAGGKHRTHEDSRAAANASSGLGQKRSVGDATARSARTVWEVATGSFSGDHFAAMPTKLARLCIQAGTSDHGACADCGAPFRRVTEKGDADPALLRACGANENGGYVGAALKDYGAAGVQSPGSVKARILAGMRPTVTIGFAQTCGCPPAPPVPCVVLDPFGGVGTTGLVAADMKRDAVLIELSEKNAKLAERRILDASGKEQAA